MTSLKALTLILKFSIHSRVIFFSIKYIERDFFYESSFLFKRVKSILRDILSSSLWGTLKFSQKFAYVKGIVKDLPCEAKAARLLRKWVFGHRRALLRPDSVDSTGTSIAHWAAQRDNPTPLFKTLKDLGAPLSRNNKVTPHCLTPKKSMRVL